MKIIYCILFLTIVGQHLVAQTSTFPKYDNFWFVGENDYQGYSTFNFDSASIVGQYVGKHKIFFDKDDTTNKHNPYDNSTHGLLRSNGRIY